MIDEMQFGFMPGKGATHALFILRMQKEFCGREKKLYMCFVDLEMAFDRVPRKVMEWALRKKGLAEVLVQAVMSLCQRHFIYCQRHGLAVPRAGDRSYVTGSIRGWSRSHLTYLTGGC